MSDLVAAVSHLLDQYGGVNGLVQRANDAGLGDLVSTWVGNGPNEPASPAQLHDAFGRDAVTTAAQHGDMPTGELLRQLGQYLPALVNHVSPEGRLPGESNGLADMALNFLRNR